MEKGIGTSSKKRDEFAWWLLLPVLPLLAYAIVPAYREYKAALAQKHSLQLRIGRFALLNRNLEEELHALNTDPFYVEKIAREELGYRRAGDVIFKTRKDITLARSSAFTASERITLAQRLKKNKGFLGTAAFLLAATWGFQFLSMWNHSRK